MSTTIDTKVVEMRFNNKHFESNVATTLSTLEKLKQSLNMNGATKGLESIDAAAKKCDVSALGSAAEAVKLKFSALEIMAVTALSNITNSAVNAGKRIVSALTIDPIKTGFSEYETKINAIQTIMSNTASKGTTMEDVTRVIGELNTYADKTIYNFAEMTRNIGTFTAAGVGLEDSAAAIQGIANLAAASGSTSQQASTAMYQLSQALSSGTVKLMDWNSVVNAGMGGQKFQDALKATAKEHGIAVDDLIKKHGSFRESLSEGWISADILNETLKKFTVEGATEYAESMVKSGKYTREQADALIKEAQAMEDAATKVKTFTQLWDTLKESAQSGWSQTWEIIVGDFEEAKSFLTEVSDTLGGIIGKSADARNEMLENWKVMGGRDDLLQSLRNAFEGISSIIKPISEAFREIFPPMTSEQLFKITEGLKNLTAKLKIGDETADKIKRTFKGLFAVIDIVRQIVVAVFKAFGSLTGTIGDLGGGLLDITAKFGDWLVKLNEAVKSSEVFDKVLQGIATAIKFAGGVIKKIINGVLDAFSIFEIVMSKMGSNVSEVMEMINSAIERCDVIEMLQSLWKGIKTLANGVVEVLKILADGLGVNLENGGIFDLVNSVIAGGVGASLISFINNIKNAFSGLKDAFEGVGDVMEGLADVLQAYQSKLKAEALIKIATAIAILAGSLLVLSFIESDKLYDSMVAIGVLFAGLMGSLSLVGTSAKGVKSIFMATHIMSAIASAILVLSIALKIISDVDGDQMMTSLLGIAGLAGIVVGTAKILAMGSNKDVIKGASQMVIFSAAIAILASVCEDLSYLGREDLAKGLTGIAALAGIMVGTAKLLAMGKNKDVIKGATQMVIFAAALKVLASVCEDLSELSWEELRRGLAGMAGLLAEVIAFTTLMGKAKHLTSTSIAILAIAGAVKIFASTISDMAGLSWDEIERGLVAMAGSLAAVTIALRFMPKNMIGTGLGLVAVASGLLVLSAVLTKLGDMSWIEIGRGMATLGGAMLILAAGLNVMKGTISGSAALLVAVAALAVLTPVLITLGGLSWSTIAKGLVVLAGAFTILGIAGYALAGVSPVILTLAGAIALVGLATLAAGAGLIALGHGLVAIAAGFTAIAGSIGFICTGIISLVAALITGIIKGIGDGIIALCDVIIKGIPTIAKALIVVIQSVCEVIIECLPTIVNTVLKLILALLDSLAEYTPRIVDSLFRFILGILDALARNIPKLIQKVVDIFMSIFSGAIEALKSVDPDVLIKGILSIGLMAGMMAALAAVASLTPMAMVGVLGMGAVIAELAIVLAAIGALAQIPGLDWLISEGGYLLETIGTAIGQFIGGLAGGIAQGFTSSMPDMATDLSDFMTNLRPFIDGAKSIDQAAMDGVKSLVGVITALTGANIVESLTSWLTGGSSLSKFGEELATFGPNIRAYADSVAGIDASAIAASATAAKALAEMTSAIPNEGGVVSWFVGENSIAKFGTELVSLGSGLKGFSDSVAGINPEAMISAAEAAKVIADMTSAIPNEGGMVAWFTGDNSVSKFSFDLVKLGKGLKGFSDEIVGINPESMVAAANAAKVLADMTSSIPNEGGIVAWFSGDNSVSKFGKEIIKLGEGLKGFSDAIIGVNPENLTAAAGAARAIAEMTAIIPNQGGMVAWFTGDNSLSKFSTDLVMLGMGLKGFSNAIVGVNPESITAAAGAAKALAEMTNHIPNQGGVVTWFTGDNSISKFGAELIALGMGLKGFANAIVGINAESISAAANSAKALAEMTSYIPNQGGVVAWFTGETSIANFANKLPALGKGLKGFSTSIEGINPENVASAANAAKALAEMTAVIPKEGGIKAWFTGETSIANFAGKLPSLGKGLKGFSDSVAGINPENVTAAANAAKSLGDMMSNMPRDVDDIVDVGKNLVTLSKKLKTYFTNMSEIGEGGISSSNNALKAMKDISTIDSGNIKAVASAIKELTNAIKDMANKVKSDLKNAGKEAIDGFVDGIDDGTSKAEKACKTMVSDCADAISDKASSFKSAGKDVVIGFAEGITANTYRAEAKAKAMAKAAAKAAKEALDINSPSKVFREMGTSVPEGFALGIDKLGGMVIASSRNMSDNAVNGVRKSISRIADIIGNDIDAQPTIRPVLDLSDIRSGASTIGGLFDGASVGVSTNLGSISMMMSRRNQNGANDDVVSAIDKLHKDLANVGNTTYQIGDVSYSEGSEVAEALQTLIRAIRVEGRT